MLKKVKTFANMTAVEGKSILEKSKSYMLPVVAGAMMLPNFVYAGTTASLMGAVLGVLCAVLKYVGIAIIAIGFVLLLLNMHDDNPEKKQKILITIVIGAAMFGAQSLLQIICNAAGLGITINQDVNI